MKTRPRLIRWAVCVLLCLLPVVTQGQGQCSLSVTCDFEAQCILNEKDLLLDMNERDLVACQGMTCTYTAFTNLDAAAIVSMVWEVRGHAAYTDNLDGSITVTWGSGAHGFLSLTVTSTLGFQCHWSKAITLVERPTAASLSVPMYTLDALGNKVIRVCQGEQVSFVDQSTAGNEDIAGHYWSCTTNEAVTPNFTTGAVTNNDIVVHRVYNNCGCYDSETYQIVVLAGDPLELDCYGTVCENATVTYHASHPTACSTYYWYVDGGTIVGGQGSSSVTVTWDSPQNGYGTLSLDGNLCGGLACPTLLTRKIPVIHSGIAVGGPASVCVGDIAVYSLPLFGSTAYSWTLTYPDGHTEAVGDGTNTVTLHFEQQGTYTIRATYECPFLGCGTLSSQPLTVAVLPPLHIAGDERVCLSNVCHLTTDPLVTADWTVYDASGNTVHTVTAVSQLNYTFPHAGQYRVTAVNPGYCRSAEHAVSVLPPPPAPTAADMDADNPTTACLNSSIQLKGQPSKPNYSLHWTNPCYPGGAPQEATGNDVTVTYGSTVCDVLVYNYDRDIECLSAAALTVHISQFQLAPYAPASPVTACPGAEIKLVAPQQEGVLYRWSIANDKQHYASVQGSALENSVRLQLNYLDLPNEIYDPFSVTLKREYCSNQSDTRSIVIDKSRLSGSLTVSANPTDPCLGNTCTLTAVGSPAIPPSATYLWRVNNNHTVSDGSLYATEFYSVGQSRVTAYYNPYDFCPDTNEYYKGSVIVSVQPLLPFNELVYDPSTNTLSVAPASSGTYSYSWTFNGSPLPDYTSSITPSSTPGNYQCTVSTPGLCSVTLSKYVDPGARGYGCIQEVFAGVVSYDYCTRILRLHASTPQVVTWQVLSGGVGVPVISGPGNTDFETTLGYDLFEVGVRYTEYGECHFQLLTFQKPFVPNFSFVKDCNKIIMHNNSDYANPNYTYRVEMVGPNNTVTSCTSSVSTPTVTFNNTYAGTYTFWLTHYNGTALSNRCYLGEVTLTTPAPPDYDVLEISIANTMSQDKTCDNTPIELTASLTSGNSIVSSSWIFDDNSRLAVNGNSVFHTFEKNQLYTIRVTATDENGCTFEEEHSITSFEDDMKDGIIVRDPLYDVCPYVNFIDLFFQNDDHSVTGYSHTNWWWSGGTGYGSSFNAYCSNDYYAYAVNENYCQGEKMINLTFLESPEAVITYDNAHFCTGVPIVLHGASGPNPSQYQYGWTVTDGGGSTVYTGNTATVTFTPLLAGTYTVRLTVSASSGCAGQDVKTLVVNPTPAAPAIAYGGNRCIGNPPVVLNASLPSGSPVFLWSNGDRGGTAHYFTPGYATAHYYDATTGCRSEDGEFYIPSAPDFDGLLTGCYERCPPFFVPPYLLPAYGLKRGTDTIAWKWYHNPSPPDVGSWSSSSPLFLKLYSTGSYQLHVDYNGGSCHADSPLLDIVSTDYCLCDSIMVSFSTSFYIDGCKLYYTVQVSVTNQATGAACFDSVKLVTGTPGINMTTNFSPGNIAPNGTYSFYIKFETSTLMPSIANFRLYFGCPLCYKDFYVELMPPINCTKDMEDFEYSINSFLSSAGTGYFDFTANVGAVQEVLAFWSEPPMVFNYLFDGYSAVNGLGMFDVARLSQMAHNGEEVCFYAITCDDDVLCRKHYCIKAADLYDLLVGEGLVYSRGKPHPAVPDAEPVLKPNPTTGEFAVEYADGIVTELMLMDMTGRQVATYADTEVADISRLATGAYIVRIRTEDGHEERVFYKKIVKK